MIRAGIVGFSEGNGHPFSFSAIINGYDDTAFANAGWSVILNYLRRQPSESFGIDDVRITHAWTQDRKITNRLCEACLIENPCTDVSDMLGEVDTLIVARDDWETHAQLAMPFLRYGIPVFVDKPLTLDSDELLEFTPYLENGLLMSCSGLRYAVEIDSLRVPEPLTGSIKLLSGTVVKGLERYGIHLIEAVASIGGVFARPVAITRLDAPHESFLLRFDSDIPFRLDCLGEVGKTFHLSVFGEKSHFHFDLHDNFTAFHRTLTHFFAMVRTGTPSIDPTETVAIMNLLSRARDLSVGSTALLSS